MEIGWIKPKGRKNIPGKPSLWITTDIFLEHFGIDSLKNLPNKNELIASGFLEKRSAISKITDLSSKVELNEVNDYENIDEENLEDFINER
jgi:segregation and condensation protein B